MKSQEIMETYSCSVKVVLLDCDVISHFIVSNALDDLPRILSPHKCVVLDFVYSEVAARPIRLAFLEKLIKSKHIYIQDFPNDLNTNKEFAHIKRKHPLIGDGERACMAVARHQRNVIASSNYRDVAPYCDEHDILYLGTLDILYMACEKGIYDEAKCDEFITNALTHNKARFPKGVTAMRFYTPKDLYFLR